MYSRMVLNDWDKWYLAMVLAQDTDVILMNEPTMFLDIRNQVELLDRAGILAGEGKTVVVILHGFEAALHYADHIVLPSVRRVLKAGAAEEVLRSGELAESFGVTPGFYEAEDGLRVYVKEARLDNMPERRLMERTSPCFSMPPPGTATTR